MVAPAEENGDLHADERDEQRHERPEGEHPLDRPERARALERQLPELLPAHEPETERAREHDHEDDASRGPQIGRRERDPIRDCGERRIGGDQQSREWHRDDADEADAARNRHDRGVRTRRDLRHRPKRAGGSDRGEKRGAADREGAEQDGGAEVDRDDPTRVGDRGDARQRERSRAEQPEVERGAGAEPGGDADQQCDDHDADPWSATGNHGGRNERGRQRGESHAGSSTIMRHPVGSACSAWIVPPCSSTIQRAIASPRPAPPRSAERARSER